MGDEIELEQEAEVVDVGDETEDTEAQGAAEGEQTPEARETRRERNRKRKEEHERIVAERATAPLKEQIEFIQRQAQQDRVAFQQMLQQALAAQQKPTEPAPDPGAKTQAALKRLMDRAKMVRDEDPESAKEFLAEQLAIIQEAAKESAAAETAKLREEFAKQSRQGPDPSEAAYFAMAPWLADKDLYSDVVREAQRVAKRENKDMRDPVTKDAVVRRAIVKVGQEWGHPVIGAQTNGGSTPSRTSAFDGDGSRTIPGGSNGAQTPRRHTVQSQALMQAMMESGAIKSEKEFFDEVITPNLKAGKRGGV